MAEPMIEAIGQEIGALCEQKRQAYGDSIRTVQSVIEVLYPEGIPKEAFGNALLLVRLMDKVCRIVTDNETMDEDPWADIAGYAIRAVEMRRVRAEADQRMDDALAAVRPGGPASGFCDH